MMDLETFLTNYGMGLEQEVVVNDNNPLSSGVDTDDYVVKNISESTVKKWGLIEKDYDDITKKIDSSNHTGYFIHVKKGCHGSLQTCFLTSKEGFEQNVYNIIVLEEGSSLDLFTGCLSNAHVKDNVHNAVTEIYVGKNAKFTMNMIHSWGEESKVYPRTVAKVEENGQFISNYVVWDPVKTIDSCPRVFLEGDRSSGLLQSLVQVKEGGEHKIGGKIFLNGNESKGEISSRIVSESGTILSPTRIEAKGKDVVGHIECDAVLLGDGVVDTIPELMTVQKDVTLSHEASIGKISGEKIEYLQTKGFSKEQAQSLVVRGFVSEYMDSMPEKVKERVDSLIRGNKFF